LSFFRGNKIALVGESGSGKSSLLAVLCGLYEPQNVELDIDGKYFDTLSPLFNITTLILQESEIFENTINYNLTIGGTYSEEKILEAIQLACFDKVLDTLPNGLHTDVREKGVTLSGGERQRLALARGILAASNSSIILMDEPTSSMDTHNEILIYDNLLSHYHDKTVISSVHHLHLLNRFDSVIVMDKGCIVQTGTFEDLKNQHGTLQSLWYKYKKNSFITH
jgi:ABC-type bacteriocin/lantibiotic exporter with double-glycine peptidase domain